MLSVQIPSPEGFDSHPTARYPLVIFHVLPCHGLAVFEKLLRTRI